MKQKQNDNLRLLFIIGVFVLTISASLLINLKNNKDYKANIVINQEAIIDIEKIRDAIKNKDAQLINKIQNIKGSENFIIDIKKQNSIFDLSIQKLPKGFMVSFSGLSSGNSLHPYFGFFEDKNGRIENIYWSQNSTAEIVTIENNKFYLKNTGIYAWNTENKWIDYISGSNLSIKSENNNEFIKPNEIGIIEFNYNKEDDLLIQNLDHQYLIEITQ